MHKKNTHGQNKTTQKQSIADLFFTVPKLLLPAVLLLKLQN